MSTPSTLPVPQRHRGHMAATCRWVAMLAGFWMVVGCASPSLRTSNGVPIKAPESKVQQLASDLRSLGPDVDPHEARAMADLALNYSLDLAERYHVVRPATLHNILVNLSLKERGLCFEWAEDLQAKLQASGPRTLQLRRVVSRINTPHEHNAVLVTVPGQPPHQGWVLDAWRHGGDLFWIRCSEDKRYPWEVRTDLPWLKPPP